MRQWLLCKKAMGVIGIAALLALTGCYGRGAQMVQKKQGPAMKSATRPELLAILQQEMERFGTLSARTTALVVKQDIYVPASVPDDVRRMRGKPYQKEFVKVEINGGILMSRMEGTDKVKFFGEVIGPSIPFMFLGKGDDFWVILPNQSAEADPSAPKGSIFTGATRPHAVRPEGIFTLRPQDISNMLLTPEVYSALDEETFCYVETWPDYYIMHFLSPEWPERIRSKIWIERQGLTMVMHQLYDGSGSIVAEGRFGAYKTVASKEGPSVQLPTQMKLLWPRDEIVMQVELSNIKVNERLDESKFNKLPQGYKMERIEDVMEQFKDAPK